VLIVRIRIFCREGGLKCRNPIENALTAKARENAATVMEQAGWRCKRGKYALPVIHMAAGNARTAGEWEVSILPAIPLCQMTNYELRMTNEQGPPCFFFF
jgi:hypothetical protein